MTVRRAIAQVLIAGAVVLIASDAALPQTRANQARLFITDVGSGKYLLKVQGRGPANANVRIFFYGDDLFVDDPLGEFGSGHSLPDGGLVTSAAIPRRFLDEDWGRDEVYAIARVGTANIQTNTIRRSF